MAECENCIHKKVCSHRANIQTDTYAYMGIKYDTEKCEYYTADVVPKSEVEQLQRKYDLAVAEREANVKGFTEELEKANAEIERLKYNLKAVLDEIPETKRELASEIFEEIESAKVSIGDFKIKTFKIISLGEVAEQTITGDVVAFSDIAELKKKYTEGEQ